MAMSSSSRPSSDRRHDGYAAGADGAPFDPSHANSVRVDQGEPSLAELREALDAFAVLVEGADGAEAALRRVAGG